LERGPFSQVEARVELLLAAASEEFFGTDIAKECVRLATAHPADFDIHTWSASICFDKSESEVKNTKDEPERHMGKTTMHGFMRGMGAATLADNMLKQGYVVTPETVQRRLAKLAAKLPAIPEGYFPDVRRQQMRYRGLATTWGGIYRCDGMRLEEPLYAKGYSYQPVRETVDLINQRGFLPLRRAIQLRRLNPIAGRPTPRVHIHGHDSLTGSCHPDDAYTIFAFLEKTLAQHIRHFAAGDLQVPVGYGLGSTWDTTYEWKRLPSKEEVRAAAWACVEAA
jgi:hypothetical protein